jgi:hypothetical protein
MSRVRIGFPTKCTYRGGNRSLGAHGRQLWIKGGRIGFGRFRLSRSIPIETVQHVEISERLIEGVARSGPTFVVARSTGGLPGTGWGSANEANKVFTDISVHTTNGQTALWVVEGRNAEWVRRRLEPALEENRIRLD